MTGPTELEELAPHVVYELRAMLAARHLHQASFGEPFSLEAFLIHVRCLYEFFSRDKPNEKHPNNRYACHYFDPVTEWATTHRPVPPAVFTPDLIDRLHRRLAHLSLDRVRWAREEKTNQWEWPVDELSDAILGYALAFVKALPPTRAAWFGGVLDLS